MYLILYWRFLIYITSVSLKFEPHIKAYLSISLDRIALAPSIPGLKGLGMRNLQYWVRICQKSHNTVTNHNYVLCVVPILMNQTLQSGTAYCSGASSVQDWVFPYLPLKMILDHNSFFLLILGDKKLADRFWWLVMYGKLKDNQ